MWQWCVEFLDEFGGLVCRKIVTAGGRLTAIREACRDFKGEYFDIEATRLR